MTIIGVGIRLTSAQAGLTATSHNISNVNTPGYSRQATVEHHRATVHRRRLDGQWLERRHHHPRLQQLLDLQAREAQTQSSHFDALSGQLSTIDQMFSDASAGLSPALDDSSPRWAPASNLADAAARQAMVSAGTSWRRAFATCRCLEALRSGVNDR